MSRIKWNSYWNIISLRFLINLLKQTINIKLDYLHFIYNVRKVYCNLSWIHKHIITIKGWKRALNISLHDVRFKIIFFFTFFHFWFFFAGILPTVCCWVDSMIDGPPIKKNWKHKQLWKQPISITKSWSKGQFFLF